MWVDTSLGRLHVQDVGNGPAVVLWHSLLCDGEMWRVQVGALGDRYRFINIDGPGHGRSSGIRRPFSMEECVDAAETVLDTVGLERVGWCGLSWGGMVGMRFALRHPGRVGALALLDTSARAERPAKKLVYRPLNALARRVGPVRPLAKGVLPLFFAPRTLRERPELAERFITGLTAIDRVSLGCAVDSVILHRTDLQSHLGDIEAPTLVMVGDQDRATPPSEAHRLKRSIPNARLMIVSGAAHLSALERPEQVNAALDEFFRAHL